MSKQLSMVEALVDPRLGSSVKLDAIASVIDWSRLEPIVRQLRSGEVGRAPYRPLAMLKALYLQRLYDLSDPGLEEALLDRLSFRRFCGLSLQERTPDETTICRFRQDAAEAGVMEACFTEITRQLEAKGLMLKRGTLMDASIIKAKHNPPPRDAGLGARHPKEPGADWAYRNGRSMFGYKAHFGVDEGSGLIRRAVATPAKTYESEVADALIVGDECAVYGDKAYPQKARHQRLKALGIKDRIMRRADRWHPELPTWARPGSRAPTTSSCSRRRRRVSRPTTASSPGSTSRAGITATAPSAISRTRRRRAAAIASGGG